MRSPDDIAEILLGILQTGLLRIRALGWDGNPDRCAVEADHVHNLPHLLSEFSFDLLKYYWEVEKPAFIEQREPADLVGFAEYWARLAKHIQPALSELPN